MPPWGWPAAPVAAPTPPQVWHCYMLNATTRATYVGVTVDLNHRLRQHNAEIKGGASATTTVVKALQKRNKEAGITAIVRPWQRMLHVRGFPSQGEVLRFEWRWKNLTKAESRKTDPVVRRYRALRRLLSLEKATALGQLYSGYTAPLEVICETEHATAWWNEATDGLMVTPFGNDGRATTIVPFTAAVIVPKT